MYHALGLLAVAWATDRWKDRQRIFRIMGFFFIAGTLLFSGSLYVFVLLDMPSVVFLTPVGGILLIAGWLMPLTLLKRSMKS